MKQLYYCFSALLSGFKRMFENRNDNGLTKHDFTAETKPASSRYQRHTGEGVLVNKNALMMQCFSSCN